MTRHSGRLKKIALTGGIGSGKSSFARVLSDFGYCVFDADKLVSEVVLQDDVRQQLVQVFGDESYTSDSSGNVIYNRPFVRECVFSDPNLRAELEKILHPRLFTAFDSRCREIESVSGAVWIFYEAALIFEQTRESSFDAVVSVLAPEEERRIRLKTSRQLPDHTISAIFAAQVSDHVRRAKSTFILENDGDVADFPKLTLELLENLRQFFHPKSR
jgi:dephospho-CoA kinase